MTTFNFLLDQNISLFTFFSPRTRRASGKMAITPNNNNLPLAMEMSTVFSAHWQLRFWKDFKRSLF